MSRHVVPTTLIATVLIGGLTIGCNHAAPAPPAPALQHAAASVPRTTNDSARAIAARRNALARNAALEDSLNRAAELANARESALREVLTAPIHFDLDEAEIRDSDRVTLDKKAALLLANRTVRLRIDGNADDRGSDEYNLALGMRRAAETRKYFAEHGVDTTRIAIASNGDEDPVCEQQDEACFGQNRRDEFLILDAPDRIKPARTANGRSTP